MTSKELVAYRTKLFRDAATFNKPDRVPHMSFFVTWKILDGGYTLNEGLRDYDIMTKVIREHQEKYNFDYWLVQSDYSLDSQIQRRPDYELVCEQNGYRIYKYLPNDK